MAEQTTRLAYPAKAVTFATTKASLISSLSVTPISAHWEATALQQHGDLTSAELVLTLGQT